VNAVAKALLRLVTAIVPVFIAACYGAPVNMVSYTGRAVDRTTGKGINGLEVTCIASNGPVDWKGDHTVTSGCYDTEFCDAGADGGSTYTMPGDGHFELGSDQPCLWILVEDLDGAENRGRYAPSQVPTSDTGAEIVVEMDLAH
jgi:hypothetical protein